MTDAPAPQRRTLIGVIGAGVADAGLAARAEAVGRALAEAGYAVVTGGLGGVMHAASKGAREAGGEVLAVLPGDDPLAATPFATQVIATGIGDARNAVLANSAAAFVAVGGEYGTLSEIAFMLKRGKPVIAWDSWDVDPQVVAVESAAAAVAALRRALESPRRPG